MWPWQKGAGPGRSFAPLWLASVLLPLLAFAGGAAWAWRSTQAEALERLARRVDTLHEHALRLFETQDALLAAVQGFARGKSWEEIAGSAELADLIRGLDATTPGAGAIGIVSPEGRLLHISTVPFPPPEVDLSERDYVRAQREATQARPFVGETVIARVGGLPVVTYSRPRLGADGRPDGGTLWATFRVRDFERFFASVQMHDRDSIVLARDDGAILLRHPPLPRQIGARVGPDMPSELLREVEPGRPRPILRLVSPFDGETRIFVARRLGDLPVGVAYGIHPDGPRAAWAEQALTLGAVSAFAALLLLLATWRAARGARREAQALERARAEAEQRASVEALLRSAQRLEALGRVSAGIAHDVRNLAGAVGSGARLTRAALEAGDGDRARATLGLIEEAAARGVALTQRLLRFGRPARGGAEAEADPAAVARETVALLAGTLAGRWEVTLDLHAPPARVAADPVELEAALVNLVLNARDALPDGGRIAVSVAGEPGGGARVAVRDDGVGMDAATLARAGESFFTTKGGEGTGLGLTTARGFAEASGGALLVESEGPGRGTTVTLRLPPPPGPAAT